MSISQVRDVGGGIFRRWAGQELIDAGKTPQRSVCSQVKPPCHEATRKLGKAGGLSERASRCRTTGVRPDGGASEVASRGGVKGWRQLWAPGGKRWGSGVDATA